MKQTGMKRQLVTTQELTQDQEQKKLNVRFLQDQSNFKRKVFASARM